MISTFNGFSNILMSKTVFIENNSIYIFNGDPRLAADYQK